jgi:hypothetical protein
MIDLPVDPELEDLSIQPFGHILLPATPPSPNVLGVTSAKAQ